ncbi:NACHT, LRR and PYD domains-containing protein 12-like [Engraulis encrasicolus]|uniref:NACHT, LRR and PYD domains-containing protein 12-like n=1 Tax=Engraulis encrasicolus TaxID=184585 RepID=UPI002FCEEF57
MPMAQFPLQSPAVIAQYPPYPNSEMGKGPVNPHKRTAQPSRQPPLGHHPADSNHILTDHVPAKRARLAGNCDLNSVLMSHTAKMKKRFESISEGIIRPGAQTLLNKIYTELYITEGESEDVNNEHEVWQVEAASRPQTTDDTSINCNDIFKPLPGQEGHIRTVMTKGIAGIGKTVSVQKFILDWAEDNANQDVDFMFVLPFRELNLVKDAQYSLHRLLLDFHPELSVLDNSEYKDCNIIFIFDGLDESRLQLYFQKNEKVSDATQLSPMNVLLTSLIQGALLPSARIWITSRPAAANQIPSQFVNLVTEVRGFSDPQKEEYFRKRINDHSLADRLITHIKASRSLFIMCHMPVFCWIAATVLQQILEEEDGREAPKTLTEMFIHFLLIQTTRKHQKYQEESEADRQRLLESHKSVILKLAELAFTHLENGNLMFYEEDLRQCGIDVSEASVYSGMCTEIFREECVFERQKVYCFVHLSIQEFLAALHVFASYLNKNVEVLGQFVKSNASITTLSLDELLKSAVNKALESKNGHLDLFVRFLHGISLTSNHGLMLGLLTHTHSSPESVSKTIKNLKVMQRPNISPERCINLFHCLVEMHNTSVHDEIQAYLKAEKGSVKQLSLAHCSALAHVLLMSDEVIDEFHLKKYKTSPEGRRRLVPVLRCCRKALLDDCKLTEASCETVASALQSPNSPLRELDLSRSDLQKSGGKLLSALQSPHCKLETLRLSGCQLTDQSCEIVANALQSPNTLLEMDLSNNALGDSGVEFVCKGLSSPHCKLQTLRLSGCQLTDKSCEFVVHALQSATPLLEMDMSNNALGDSGVEFICKELSSPHCKLQTLRLSGCQLTDQSCEVVANALQSANTLLEMDLSNNALGDSGVEFICKGLSSPHCKLQTLRLNRCDLSKASCDMMASVLQWSSSPLRELDMSDNNLQDEGVELLCVGLKHPQCKLETLRLSGCQISPKGCSFLASALKSNPSYLKELDLTYNHPGEAGVRELSDGLNEPSCKLETLRFDHGGECRMKPGHRKYACELTLDPNTANIDLSLSEGNRKVTCGGLQQQYPDHPDRFDYWSQVLCREGLSGRCYWEAEWSGDRPEIAVAYKSIQRKGGGNDSRFGWNDKSWSLDCSSNSYTARHNSKMTDIPAPSPRSSRVGVYLDWPAGTLSFYSVSSDTLTHLHTFHSTFTKPLYPGFCVYSGSSVSLCQIT